MRLLTPPPQNYGMPQPGTGTFPSPTQGYQPAQTQQPSTNMWSTTAAQPKEKTSWWQSAKNALASTGKAIGGFGVGFAKGVMSLPQEAASLGRAIGTEGAALMHGVSYAQQKAAMEKGQGTAGELAAGQSKGIDKTKEQFAPKNTAEKVGFGAEKTAEFFVPGVGEEAGAELAAKIGSKIPGLEKGGMIAEKVLPFVGKSGASALEMGSKTALQTGGDWEETKKATEFGALMPGVNLALAGTGKLAGGIIEHISSKLSGVPKEAIEHAIENPEATRKAIRAMAKDPKMGPQQVLENAVDALDTMKEARRAAYRSGLEKVEKETMQTKGGQWYVKKFDKELGKEVFVPTDFSLKGVKDTITRTLKEFGGASKSGEIDLEKVALPSSYKKDLQEVVDKIYGWDDISPMGLDDLRENIDVYRRSSLSPSTADKKFNKILGDIRTNLSKYVSDKVPQIGEMNRSYAKMSEPIEQIASELRLEKNPVTAMRKLTNVFSPKSVVYRDLVKQLGDKGAKDLLSDIAGLTMSKWYPEGIAAFLAGAGEGGFAAVSSGHGAIVPAIAATAAAASPRIVGETATMLGSAKKALEPLSSELGQLEKGVAAQTIREPEKKKPRVLKPPPTSGMTP